MNEQIIEAINSFAKANKISKAKLNVFVEDVIEMLPKQQSRVNGGNGKVGRKMTDEAKRTLEFFKDPRLTTSFTSKEIASKINVHPATVNNCLRRLEQEGKVMVVGVAEAIGPGRKASIWQIAN